MYAYLHYMYVYKVFYIISVKNALSTKKQKQNIYEWHLILHHIICHLPKCILCKPGIHVYPGLFFTLLCKHCPLEVTSLSFILASKFQISNLRISTTNTVSNQTYTSWNWTSWSHFRSLLEHNVYIINRVCPGSTCKPGLHSFNCGKW